MGSILWFAVALGALGLSPTDVERAKRSVFQAERYQRTMPHQPAPEATPSRPLRTSPPPRLNRPHRARPQALNPVSSEVGSALVKGVLIVLGVLGLLWLVLRMTDAWRSRVVAFPAPRSGSTPQPIPKEEMTTSEELAGRGAYADAIRALLNEAILHLRAKAVLDIGCSTTGREVLRQAKLKAEGAGALRALVDAVEITCFAGEPADRARYEGCRAQKALLDAAIGPGDDPWT